MIRNRENEFGSLDAIAGAPATSIPLPELPYLEQRFTQGTFK
jgi:hypothetical protein